MLPVAPHSSSSCSSVGFLFGRLDSLKAINLHDAVYALACLAKIYNAILHIWIAGVEEIVGYNVPFLSFVTWQIASAAVINGVGNADLSCVYKGPVVPLQSLHTIVVIDESVPKNRPS